MGSREMQNAALVTREAHQALLDLKKLVDTATQRHMRLNWRPWVKQSAVCDNHKQMLWLHQMAMAAGFEIEKAASQGCRTLSSSNPAVGLSFGERIPCLPASTL